MPLRLRLIARALPTLFSALLLSSPAAAQGASGFDDQVLVLVNQVRQAAGLHPLARNRALDLAAQLHAQDMARGNFMSHYGSNGSNPAARMRAAGYPWTTWAENVAVGYSTPAAVMNGWMNSPGHRRNILSAAVREIGIGVAHTPGSGWRTFWCQDFGNRSGAVTLPTEETPTENTPFSEGADDAGPIITDTTPDAGASGTLVVITGSGFGNGENGCVVLYGITGSAQIESWSDTRIVVRIYNARPGQGSLRVCNGSGQMSNPAGFRVRE